MKAKHCRQIIDVATSHCYTLWMLYNLSREGGQICHLWYNDFYKKNDSYLIATRAKYEMN